jgi:ribosomal protein S18 acetylase RimI-like enzyme
MITLRTLRFSDKSSVFTLGCSIFREDEIPLLQKALALCIEHLSYVAVEDKKIIGFTLVCVKPTNVYFTFMTTIPSCYEFAFLGISPACQGRGLGSRLLKEAIHAIFQESNQFTCWLLVDYDNYAIHMYKKYGFRLWAETATTVPGYIMGLSHRRYHFITKNDKKLTLPLPEEPLIVSP